jgi:hypothetical protein
MMDPEAWRVAYARQAVADLNAREVLLEAPSTPQCQQLHFLQMACEKICKSYLCGHGADPATLQSSHAYVARLLPIIFRQQLAAASREAERGASWVANAVRKLARQIELLAPAVDDGGRYPANCEYPWEDPKGAIVAPADYNFQIDVLHAPAGRRLIKILRVAAAELMQTQTE